MADPIEEMMRTFAATREDVAAVRQEVAALGRRLDGSGGLPPEVVRSAGAAYVQHLRAVADGLGWKVRLLVVALLVVLLGLLPGVILGVYAFPARLLATGPGCKLAGGYYYPADPARGASRAACTFWGE